MTTTDTPDDIQIFLDNPTRPLDRKEPKDVADLCMWLMDVSLGYTMAVEAIAEGDKRGPELMAMTYQACRTDVYELAQLLTDLIIAEEKARG